MPVARGRPFRRGGSQARLIVRTPSGDASFDFPTLGGDELRDHVRVLVERFGRR